MIQYTSNISLVVKAKLAQLEKLAAEKDQVVRAVVLALVPEVRKRVHVEGKDSTGAQIGTYSAGYMKIRTGAFANASKFSKGKNKGNLKDSGTFTANVARLDKRTGVFTGEEKIGQARPNYNRGADTKVILSLTRQMENDISPVASGTGYGIGYTNPHNFDKSQWNEATYNKKIWDLTKEEKELARHVATSYVDDLLKQL